MRQKPTKAANIIKSPLQNWAEYRELWLEKLFDALRYGKHHKRFTLEDWIIEVGLRYDEADKRYKLLRGNADETKEFSSQKATKTTSC